MSLTAPGLHGHESTDLEHSFSATVLRDSVSVWRSDRWGADIAHPFG
jgi:hypothetical protein